MLREFSRVGLIEIGFGLCSLMKLLTSRSRRGPGFMEVNGYLWYRYVSTRHLVAYSYRSVRIMAVVAIATSVLMTVQVAAPVCAAVLAGWYVVELSIAHKFHVCYFILIGGILAIDPLARLVLDGPAEANLTLAAIALTTTVMYWTSGIRKLASPSFRNGDVLRISLSALDRGRADRLFYDSPGWLLSRAAASVQNSKVACALSLGVITVEILLPIILISGSTLVALCLGCALHASFGLLGARTLSHFGALTLLTYAAFPAMTRL